MGLIGSTSGPGATMTGKREGKEMKKGNILAYHEEHTPKDGKFSLKKGGNPKRQRITLECKKQYFSVERNYHL
jgi:hypothetical protein